MKRALEDGDAAACAAEWAARNPHLPQPESAAEAEITMHYARTLAESVPVRGRCYSHRWLEDRGLPSGLPDRLKPSADRLYPRIVSATGFVWAGFKPIRPHIERVVSDAIEDAYAEGRTQPEFIRARVTEAKDREIKRLLG